MTSPDVETLAKAIFASNVFRRAARRTIEREWERYSPIVHRRYRTEAAAVLRMLATLSPSPGDER